MLITRLAGLIALLLLFSCTKDELTRPVPVELLLEIEQNAQGQEASDLEVTGGRFLLSEIGFDGYREGGENYFFTRSFPDSLKVNFTSSGSSHILDFDMPKGVYNRIDIHMEIPAGRETLQKGDVINRSGLNGGVEIWGNYFNTSGLEIPFIFIYTAVDELKLTAKSASGQQQVVVKDKDLYRARIRFSPQQWMELISARMLQSAKISMVEGVPTVVIAKTQNDQIYNLLANRIEQSAQLLIE